MTVTGGELLSKGFGFDLIPEEVLLQVKLSKTPTHKNTPANYHIYSDK